MDHPTNSAYASSRTTIGAGRPSAAASASSMSRNVSITPSGSGSAVGLFGEQSQRSAASCAASRIAGRSSA